MSLPVEVQERVVRVLLALLVVIAIILVMCALKSLYFVVMPVVFALFLSVLLYPIQVAVSAWLPVRARWLGTVASLLLLLAILALAAGAIWWSLELFVKKGPEYQRQFEQFWDQTETWLREHGVPLPQQLAAEEAGLPRPIMRTMAQSLYSVMYAGAFAVIVFFLVLLLLLEAGEWKRKLLEAFFGPRTKSILETVEAVASKLRRYFYVRTLISFFSAVIEGLWIWALGIDFALAWGLLFFVLNFVPNIGSLIAAIPPITLAFVQFGTGRAVLTALGLLTIEQIIGNFIDPRIQGQALKISPVVVLVAILFWTWAWGIAGIFLAVPITIAIMIVCAYVPVLEPVAILLTRPGNAEILSPGRNAADGKTNG